MLVLGAGLSVHRVDVLLVVVVEALVKMRRLGVEARVSLLLRRVRAARKVMGGKKVRFSVRTSCLLLCIFSTVGVLGGCFCYDMFRLHNGSI